MAAKFETHERDDGSVSFRLVAANGEVVAEGQSYRDEAAAREGMHALKDAAAEATVPGEHDLGGDPPDGIRMHY